MPSFSPLPSPLPRLSLSPLYSSPFPSLPSRLLFLLPFLLLSPKTLFRESGTPLNGTGTPQDDSGRFKTAQRKPEKLPGRI